MIVNIAGTSGSGKSHLIRSFLTWVDEQDGRLSTVHGEGREAPLGYLITGLQGVRRPIHLVGSYLTPTGGCDTISDVLQAYQLVLDAHELKHHVIYEGLFMMNMTRGPALVEVVGADNFHVIQLITSLATCIASINKRRTERGEGKLLTKANTKGNYVRAENYCNKLRGMGVNVVRTPRDYALDVLLGILRLE